MGFRVKKGDTVYIIAGKEKGKTGKVLRYDRQTGRVLVQGINFASKHSRKTRADQPGGILKKENPLHISNLMFQCPRCNKPAKLAVKMLSDGTKTRICKNCQEMV